MFPKKKKNIKHNYLSSKYFFFLTKCYAKSHYFDLCGDQDEVSFPFIYFVTYQFMMQFIKKLGET
jgi:hypothetical protein